MSATVIGAHARVSGSIEVDGELEAAAVGAHDVLVLGRVVGAIRASGVIHLAPSADVRGDLEGARVVIDEGATFEGRVRLLGDAPTARQVPALSAPGRRRLSRRTS